MSRSRRLRLDVSLLWSVCFVIAIVGCPSRQVVMARGEPSYRLPETRETVPRSSHVVQYPRWFDIIDVPPDQFAERDLLAHGNGVVAFASRGHVCGFAEYDGKRLWCAGPGAAPVYAAGEFAYSAPDGSIVAVNATTGTGRWRHRFLGASVGATHFTSEDRESVWPAGDSFLVAGSSSLNGGQNYGEIDLLGRVLWKTTDIGVNSGVNPVIAWPYAFQLTIADVANQPVQQLLLLGSHGGLVARIGGAREVLEAHPPFAAVGGEPLEAPEDSVLTFNVWIIDLRNGGIKKRFHYEPDYDTNYAAYNELFPPGTTPAERLLVGGDDRLHLEGDLLYGFVGLRLYRYHLSDPHRQRPLLVSKDDDYIGGPYRGIVYVARAGGLWALRPRVHDVQARLIAASPSGINAFSISGNTVYIGFYDREVRGVNFDDGRTVFDARPCLAGRIGVGPHRVYIVCAGLDHRVVAFEKPEGS